MEKEELNEDIWSFDEPKVTTRDLMSRIIEIKKTSPMDKKFVYNLYKLMTMEIELPDYFMVINTKVVKDTKTTKLQQVLDAQKEETLTSILALIAARNINIILLVKFCVKSFLFNYSKSRLNGSKPKLEDSLVQENIFSISFTIKLIWFSYKYY